MLRLAHLRNVLTKSFTCAVQRSGASNKETITPIVYTFPQRAFSLTNTTLCDAHEEDQDGEKKSKNKSYRAKYGGTERDRSRQIPVEESIEYINSSAFKAAYGDKLPWELYRRVHKGQLPKARTRKSCIIQNVVAIGSPCPICRDEYLVLHHTNLDLLRMFISPYTGQVRNVYNKCIYRCITGKGTSNFS